MHAQVPLGEHDCSGCTVGFPGPLVVSVSEQRLTLYICQTTLYNCQTTLYICQAICCILDTKSMV